MNDLSGRMVARRYHVRNLIGEGAMSSVYLAQNVEYPNTKCALKMLKRHLTYDPKFGRRFTDEAKSLAKLSHPNILKMYEFFRDGDDYFIALAYVDGMSLGDMIDCGGAIPEAKALPIFKAILSALDHGHQNGIIHRDVKPPNILIDKSGRPLLCDFGIAKQVAERGVTASGMTLGTPEYMSPEQIQSPQTLDHRTDVYSAGVVLFEMLTGRVPFVDDTTDSDFAVRKHQVESDPPDPRSINPGISPELARIVLKSLRKNPSRRYQGCFAFLDAIEKYEKAPHFDEGGGDVPPAPPPEAPGGSRQYRVYEHPTLGLIAVKKGFSWPALLANIAWMFAEQLYPQAARWAAVYLGLFVFLIVVRDARGAEGLLVLVILGALLFLWLMPGFRGNIWRETELARRGFVLKGTVRAANAGAAVARMARRS